MKTKTRGELRKKVLHTFDEDQNEGRAPPKSPSYV
ncbi:hypothetical protein J2S19_003477 [Metabacillus malikii]|uniref:Uncharacterized protein n=1 Tax=Metabacillus malikii TaxID=1504265 RepID=A0ABT9ZLX0_9BACI|nr:hypothetical protein [Metabacillus malikii]